MKHIPHLITVGLFLVPWVGEANVVGPDAQNFNTITSGLDFVTVQSAETLDPGIINFGLFANEAWNSLSYLGGVTTNGSNVQDTLVTSDLNFGMGILERWDAGVSFPNVLMNNYTSSTAGQIALKSTGFYEVRPNTKFRFLGNHSQGLALVLSANFNLIQNDPYAGAGAGPTYNFELAGKTTVRRWALGANLGYRLRTPGQAIAGFAINPSSNQYIGSLASSYLIPNSDVKIIAEIYGAVPTTKINSNTDNTATVLEGILGAKYDVTESIALHLGAGTRIVTGVASPDYRIYTGINWALGPLWGRENISTQIVQQPSALYMTETIKSEVPDSEPSDESQGKEISSLDNSPKNVVFFAVPTDILFAFGSDRLIEQYSGTLKSVAQFSKQLKAQPFKALVIEGHTDSVGNARINLDLSKRRAARVKIFMVQKYGVDSAKVIAIGYGKSKPIADNGNYQGRRRNRRVVFKLFKH